MKKKGRSFDCKACPPGIQTIRRCKEPRWDFENKDGPHFPIKLTSESGLGFCPAKLFRDDPLSVYTFDKLYLTWKAGSIEIDELTEEEMELYVMLIKLWESYDKQDSFTRLGHMFCGDKDDNKTRT